MTAMESICSGNIDHINTTFTVRSYIKLICIYNYMYSVPDKKGIGIIYGFISLFFHKNLHCDPPLDVDVWNTFG